MIKNNIAILIDAENISFRYVKSLMKQTNAYIKNQNKISGNNTRLTHNLAFANWAILNNKHWIEKLQLFGIKQKQAASYSKGKNSSDMSLTIYAIDAAFQKNIDTFIIITGDSDFTELVFKLREYGKEVIVCGEEKANISISCAGNDYWVLEKEETEIEKEEKLKKEDELDNQKFIDEHMPKRIEKENSIILINELNEKEKIIIKEKAVCKKSRNEKTLTKISTKTSTKKKNVSFDQSKIYALTAYRMISKRTKCANIDISALYQEMKRLSKEDKINIDYKKMGFGRLRYYINDLNVFNIKEEIKKEQQIIVVKLKK